MSIRATILATALALGLSAPAQADDRERAWLDAHNAARADFGSAPLRWNAALAQEAERWAIILARSGQLRHSSPAERRGAGENLWMGTQGFFEARQMIASFVEERRDFRPGRFPEVSRTGRWSDVGHYTQIVWPETREVGCAVAAGARYDALVCRYWPAGNRIGETIAPQSTLAAR